jgi:hypothetical protein
MKHTFIALAAVMTFTAAFAGGPARADSDDIKWIGQCVSDNKDEGQTPQVITSYCTCMNDKMSSNETRSITQWEKTHKREMEACATQAGWKGR